MKWYRIWGEDIKQHIVSEEFLEQVEDDLKFRGASDTKFELRNKFHLDLPGMVAIGRPWKEFLIDDFTLDLPCEDVATLSALLQEIPIRKFPGTEYYKLHGWWTCIVLNPDQRNRLLKEMKSSVDDCEIESMNFYKNKNGMTLPRTNGSRTIDDGPFYFDPVDKQFKKLIK